MIRKRFLWLLLFPFLGAAVAIFYLFFVATLYYESSALVFIDPQGAIATGLAAADPVALASNSASAAESRLLSRAFWRFSASSAWSSPCQSCVRRPPPPPPTW